MVSAKTSRLHIFSLANEGHSRQDSLAGSEGISSLPWWSGSLCHSSLAALNLSETRGFRYAKEMNLDQAVLSAALPVSRSVRSLPGIPGSLD
jgi:hypothetical protein